MSDRDTGHVHGRTGVETLVRTYLAEKTPAWAENTVRQARRVLAGFLRFVTGGVPLPEHVVAYVVDVRARRTPKGALLAAAAAQGLLLSVRRFLSWALLHGHILQDLAGLILVRPSETLPRTLNEGEVEALIEKGARDARERAVLEVLYGTGLRAGELCRLAIDDVDLLAGLLYVRQGKGRKDRVVPLGERVRTAVLAYLRECRPRKGGPLFLTVRGRPLTRGTLEDLVWKAGRRAGLTRLASPHRLRHSFATHLLRNGADIRHIQLLMGHASLSSTQVYLDIDVSDLDRMLEKSHPRERMEPDERLPSDCATE